MTFVRYCLIISIKNDVKIVHKNVKIVQVLEKLDGNETIARSALDTLITSKKSKKILKLLNIKVSSEGLNDQLGEDFIKEKTHVLIESKSLVLQENFSKSRS